MTLRKLHSYRTINSVAVIVVAAMLAAACGGDDDPAVVETPPDPTTTTTVVEPSEDVAADSLLEEEPAATEAISSPDAPVESSIEEFDGEYRPVLIVDPPTVPSVGDYNFTINGTGFVLDSPAWILICTIPGDPVSVDTPVQELSDALAAIGASDCDMSTAETVDVEADGSFFITRNATVGQNFAWTASNEAEPYAASAPILLEELEQPDEAAPETTIPDAESESPVEDAEVIEPADPISEPEQPDAETTPVEEQPDPETTPEEEQPDPAPEQSEPEAVTPEPVAEPEQPETPRSNIVCIRDSEGVLACQQVVPDDYICEAVGDDLLCRPPGSQQEPTPEPDPVAEPAQPPEAVEGDIVCPRDTAGVVACPEVVPADYICENVDEGMVCHPPGWERDPEQPLPIVQEYDVDWTAPVAGMVPAVHPDTPLSEWQRGPVDPKRRAYDKPRPTEIVVGWSNWCSHQNAISCRFLLHEMKQALDYLGAHPQCVLNVATERVNHHVAQGSSVSFSYSRERFGWYMCATVIDPIVVEIPTGSRQNDEGLRLSDTPGITLAERCRVVLADPFPDIQLETRSNDPTRAIHFGSDCDAWAVWVIENGAVRSSPGCNASMHLAEEWMEYHHDQHPNYFRPRC